MNACNASSFMTCAKLAKDAEIVGVSGEPGRGERLSVRRSG